MAFGLEIIGLYYGSYRAFVMDNEDPLEMNRVKLMIPMLNSSATLDNWALPIGFWGGKGYGVQMLPRKGDMVWVEFESGNADYPIWKHASYAEGEKPKEFKTHYHYGFKTPRGSLILINDNKDEEEIFIKHSNDGEWVKINKELLEFEAKLIKLGKNGDEQGVLGNTLFNKLDELHSKLDETYSAINAHTHTTNNGPSGPPINIANFQTIQSDVNTIQAELDEILSNKVKIDK